MRVRSKNRSNGQCDIAGRVWPRHSHRARPLNSIGNRQDHTYGYSTNRRRGFHCCTCHADLNALILELRKEGCNLLDHLLQGRGSRAGIHNAVETRRSIRSETAFACQDARPRFVDGFLA